MVDSNVNESGNNDIVDINSKSSAKVIKSKAKKVITKKVIAKKNVVEVSSDNIKEKVSKRTKKVFKKKKLKDNEDVSKDLLLLKESNIQTNGFGVENNKDSDRLNNLNGKNDIEDGLKDATKEELINNFVKDKNDLISKNKKLGMYNSTLETQPKHEKIIRSSLHNINADVEFTPEIIKITEELLFDIKKYSVLKKKKSRMSDKILLSKLIDEIVALRKNIRFKFYSISELNSDLDSYVDYLYLKSTLNIEEKTYFRELIVSMLQISQESILNENGDYEVYTADFYGLPTCSTYESMLEVASNQEIQEIIEKSCINNNYFNNESEVHLLTNYPVTMDAMSKPNFLMALSYYSLIFKNKNLSKKRIDDITKNFDIVASNYLIKDDKESNFIIPCIRIFKGSYEQLRKTNEHCHNWRSNPKLNRNLDKIFWDLSVSHNLSLLNIKNGEFLIKPPVPPLIAQAHSIAWKMVHQIYKRLGDRGFRRIDALNINEQNDMALKAFGFKKNLLAQSDVFPLFDMLTCPEEFSNILKYECTDNGPRTLLRELFRFNDFD